MCPRECLCRRIVPDPPIILAELFTATHLRQLAWYGRSDTLRTSAHLLEDKGLIPRESCVEDVFNAAFRVLRRDYPVEYLYKACVLDKTVLGRNSPKTTALYMEFPVAEARADMLLVNGHAEILEVKTRFDSTARLRQQVEAYGRCFKFVNILVEQGQIERFAEVLPKHVGIKALTPRFSISNHRSAREYLDHLDPVQIFRLLHQRERREAIASLGVDTSEFHPVRRPDVELGLFLSLDPLDAYDRMVCALQRRQRTIRMAALCAKLPSSLQAAVFAYRLQKADWERLKQLCAKPITLLEHKYVSGDSWSYEC